jgi:hypothetical protein
MGSFTYSIGDEVRERFVAAMPLETKAVVAAELRGRGLNCIAASLEDSTHTQDGGVVQPNRSMWQQTFDTDVMELLRSRFVR